MCGGAAERITLRGFNRPNPSLWAAAQATAPPEQTPRARAARAAEHARGSNLARDAQAPGGRRLRAHGGLRHRGRGVVRGADRRSRRRGASEPTSDPMQQQPLRGHAGCWHRSERHVSCARGQAAAAKPLVRTYEPAFPLKYASPPPVSQVRVVDLIFQPQTSRLHARAYVLLEAHNQVRAQPARTWIVNTHCRPHARARDTHKLHTRLP